MSEGGNKKGERKRSRTSLSKNAIKATKAVRIPQEGCQVSLRVTPPVTHQQVGSTFADLLTEDVKTGAHDSRMETGNGEANLLVYLESTGRRKHVDLGRFERVFGRQLRTEKRR